MLPGEAPPGRGAPGRGAPGRGACGCGRGIARSTGCTDENGLLVELEIVLDDGGRLVVGGGRPACEHDEEAMPQAV